MKQTFGKFELEAECVFAKPEQKDFDNGLNSLGIQYGAIKAATKVGNTPTSMTRTKALN